MLKNPNLWQDWHLVTERCSGSGLVSRSESLVTIAPATLTTFAKANNKIDNEIRTQIACTCMRMMTTTLPIQIPPHHPTNIYISNR